MIIVVKSYQLTLNSVVILTLAMYTVVWQGFVIKDSYDDN